jgi:DNA-binding NarL/FixJ family response regulator
MNNPPKIRLALVDDHSLMRNALSSMLQEVNDFEIVGSFSSGEELLNHFRDLNIDVVIMDIVMNGMSGIETTRWLKERNSKSKVILLSGEINKEFVTSGIQSGIDGYLPKDVEKIILVAAIRSVYGGDKYFNDAIKTLVFEDFYKKEKSVTTVRKQLNNMNLTKREAEVFTLIATGKTNHEVGNELFISIKTVDTHKSHILDKLGLKNMTELVRYAIKNKLISSD